MTKKRIIDLEPFLDTMYGMWNAPFGTVEMVRSLFEPKIKSGDISDAVEWECRRQGLDPKKVDWREIQTQDLIWLAFGGGRTYKTSPDKYAIELTVPTKITTIRHEVRHIQKGHVEDTYGNLSPKVRLKHHIMHIFRDEPLTFMYAS